MEAEWESLGKVQYRKWNVYDSLEWASESGVTDLRDYLSAIAPFGGPIALLRNPKRLLRVEGRAVPRELLIFTGAGRKICSVSWEPYEEKGAAPLIDLFWTDELHLICVFADGSCVSFSARGEKETNFAILPPHSKDKVASISYWGAGFVALSEKLALIQVLDIDSVRPKVFLLPDSGLSESNAPTCMTVLEPRFLKSSSPEVLLATSSKSIVSVSKSGGCQDLELQESLPAPVSAMAIAPNGMFMAAFCQDGSLTVMTTALDQKILTFDTQAKSAPEQMCWCGEDSVMLFWPSGGLIMVGPYGSWLRYPYDDHVYLRQEVDSCRIISTHTHDIVIRVPSSVENIRRIGSTANAAMLFQALDMYDSGDAKADENIRAIQQKGQAAMDEAIKDCVTAAGAELDYSQQTVYLRAASYGKCFIDAATMDASSIEHEALDPELFVDMCRKIRVLNALRDASIGFPLTSTQYDRLGADAVISRLVALHHHFLALKICEYLHLPTDRVLVHWACEKVKAADNMPDEDLVALVRRKLASATLVSYADIASCAERVNRRRLATMFLELEPNASDQVPLLLSMGELELALRKAIDSNNTDLVYMALFHLERTLPDMDQFRFVLYRDPKYQEAVDLMLQFYRTSKSTKIQSLWNDAASAEYDISQAAKSEDVEERARLCKEAGGKYTNAKQPLNAKLCEEQADVVHEQKKIEDKAENVKKRKLVGKSVSDTIRVLVRDSKYEPKLVAVANSFAKKCKVPDKRLYRVKIQALAETQQWDSLQKLSQEKKTPPCGFKAFAVACLAHGELKQAESYTTRITNSDEKFETLMHLEMYRDALQLAIRLKDPEKLTTVRNLSRDAEIEGEADRAAVELGFVS